MSTDLLRPYAADDMEADPVDKHFGDARNNHAELIKQLIEGYADRHPIGNEARGQRSPSPR